MTERGHERMPLGPRLVISLVSGLLALTVSCCVAYRSFVGSVIRHAPEVTLSDISRITRAIEAYRQEKHALPKSLGDLPTVNVRSDREGQYVDWWGRPLHYRVDDDHYRVTSYGDDGEPGGVGPDYDLSSDDLTRTALTQNSYPPLPRLSRPTFSQFVNHRGWMAPGGSGQTMFILCLLTGVVVSVLTFREVDRAPPAGQGMWSRAIRLLFTVGGTLFIAMLIILIHKPSGH